MSKQPKTLEDFPPDVQEVVYDLLAMAILRAIKNGTFVQPVEPDADDESRTIEQRDQISYKGRKMKPEDYPLILKASDVAKIMGVSRPTAYTYMKNKDFPIIGLPGTVKRVSRDQFFEWLNSRKRD